MSAIADVDERTSMRPALAAMASHTAPWSAARSPDAASDSDTCFIFSARPDAKCARGAALNDVLLARHRPASTHDTGMAMSDSAATRIVRLTTRFCFAPI